MLSRKLTRSGNVTFALIAAAILAWNPASATSAQEGVGTGPGGRAAVHWETPARKHRALLWTKARGTLVINETGIQFRSAGGRDQHWAFEDVQTAFLAPHRLELDTYLNRSWHRPGTQHYKFDLTNALPPEVAEAVATRIARPVQNADPDPAAPAIAVIPVRHRALTGGTNGVLRFRNGGIDYVTNSKDDSRSWRWADLQTLSDPGPYHLFIFGYRDTYTFDLKAPLSRALFNHATDEIYAHSQALAAYAPQTAHEPDAQQTGAR